VALLPLKMTLYDVDIEKEIGEQIGEGETE